METVSTSAHVRTRRGLPLASDGIRLARCVAGVFLLARVRDRCLRLSSNRSSPSDRVLLVLLLRGECLHRPTRGGSHHAVADAVHMESEEEQSMLEQC